MKKVLIGVAGSVLVLLSFQIQPWFPAAKPLGPSAEDQRMALVHESIQMGRELRAWRSVAKVRGYYHQEDGYQKMVNENPRFADYDRRSNKLELRTKKFLEEHPEYKSVW